MASQEKIRQWARDLAPHLPERPEMGATAGQIGMIVWPKMQPDKAARRAGLALWKLRQQGHAQRMSVGFRTIHWRLCRGA